MSRPKLPKPTAEDRVKEIGVLLLILLVFGGAGAVFGWLVSLGGR